MIHLASTSFLELVRTTMAALLECEVLTGEVIQILDTTPSFSQKALLIGCCLCDYYYYSGFNSKSPHQRTLPRLLASVTPTIGSIAFAEAKLI